MPIEQRLAVRISEAAALIGVSRYTWSKMRRRGLTPPEKKLGKTKLVAMEDMRRWFADLPDATSA